MLALRFANTLFEPVWNRNYVDQRPDHRCGGHGDRRPGRLLRALRAPCATWCRITCSSCSRSWPWSRRSAFDANRLRDEKLQVLEAIVPPKPEEVAEMAVRAQYSRQQLSAATQGHPATCEEEGVAKDSRTRDLRRAAAVRVQNWRWAGVPFYLRTGKQTDPQGDRDRPGHAQAGSAPRIPDRRARSAMQAERDHPHRSSPTRACRCRSGPRSPVPGCASGR